MFLGTLWNALLSLPSASARCSWGHCGFHCCPLPFPFQEKKDVHACVVCVLYTHPHKPHTHIGPQAPTDPRMDPEQYTTTSGRGGRKGEPQRGKGTGIAPGMPRPRDRGSLRWVRFAYLPKLLSCPSSAGPALVLAHVSVPVPLPVPVPVLVLLIIVSGPHAGIIQIPTHINCTMTYSHHILSYNDIQ